MTVTHCGKCGGVEFYKDGRCKTCARSRAAKYYASHKDEVLAYGYEQRASRKLSFTEKQVERFWSHVGRKNSADCWDWLLGRDSDGYGSVRFSGVTYHASRIAWILTYGDPGRLKVLHHCDNRACCNPAHLFLGTNKDNSHDMTLKGRSCPGEKNGNHKLTISQVAEIRALYAQGGISQRELARRYNTDRRNVAFIIRGETWA